MSIAVRDIIFNDDIEFDLTKGDFKVDFSDQQHIRDIYTIDLGQARQFPLIGLGILRDVNGSPNRIALNSRIRRMLNYDNYNVLTLDISGDMKISTNALRVKNTVTP